MRSVALVVALLGMLIADAVAFRAVLAALYVFDPSDVRTWVLLIVLVGVFGSAVWLTLRVGGNVTGRFGNRDAKPF